MESTFVMTTVFEEVLYKTVSHFKNNLQFHTNTFVEGKILLCIVDYIQ